MGFWHKCLNSSRQVTAAHLYLYGILIDQLGRIEQPIDERLQVAFGHGERKDG